MKLIDGIVGHAPAIGELRREIHAHPELNFKEVRTGSRNALGQEPAVASEDFAFMLQAQAGAYCVIGNGDGAHRESGHGDGPCMPHNPSFDFNDALIPLGATYWVRLAEAWLGQKPR